MDMSRGCYDSSIIRTPHFRYEFSFMNHCKTKLIERTRISEKVYSPRQLLRINISKIKRVNHLEIVIIITIINKKLEF